MPQKASEKKYFVRWPWELNALQLKSIHANNQIKKTSSQIWQHMSETFNIKSDEHVWDTLFVAMVWLMTLFKLAICKWCWKIS